MRQHTYVLFLNDISTTGKQVQRDRQHATPAMATRQPYQARQQGIQLNQDRQQPRAENGMSLHARCQSQTLFGNSILIQLTGSLFNPLMKKPID